MEIDLSKFFFSWISMEKRKEGMNIFMFLDHCCYSVFKYEIKNL